MGREICCTSLTCEILLIFDARKSEEVFLQGVYEIPSLMNHDCVGNTRLAMGADEDHRLSVFAATKIDSGTPILFNYVSALDTTDTRLRCKRIIYLIWAFYTDIYFICSYKWLLSKRILPKCFYCEGVIYNVKSLRHLSEFKFFTCACARCQDPTEFGTFNSAVTLDCGGCTTRPTYALPKGKRLIRADLGFHC